LVIKGMHPFIVFFREIGELKLRGKIYDYLILGFTRGGTDIIKVA